MTVHCIDGRDWQTKLECVSKLAKERKEAVFNNLGHIITLESLKETYRKMDGSKAVGIDKVTKEKYSLNLEQNLKNLVEKIRKGSYYPQAARIVEIPKEDGSTRPLAISCFEDKLVQEVVYQILTAIFEPMFLPCSFGFRENHSCHEALRKLMKEVYLIKDGAVVEIDIRKCFNKIPHKPLLEILQRKISDKRFLKLVEKLMRTPTIENGKVEDNRLGCPQGSIISPILANIYLHNVIDVWFEELKRIYFHGRCEMVRYADDMVFILERYKEAEKFYGVLPLRLSKYGLSMNEEKSQLLKSGETVALYEEERHKKLGTYKFLGFQCYWGKSRSGRWRLKFKSRADRFTATLKRIKEFLYGNLNSNSGEILERLILKVKGWVNYHAISDNKKRVKSFLYEVSWLIFKWYNRKGGKRPMTWARLFEILQRVGFPTTFKTTSMFCS